MKKRPVPPTDRKTRAQRALLKDAGVPPSPPQAYTQPKRSRKAPQPAAPEPTITDPVPSISSIDVAVQAIPEISPTIPKGKKPISFVDASSQTPPLVPQERQNPFNIPVDRSISHSTICIVVDHYPSSGPAPGHEPIMFTVPTAFIPSILSYITSHPCSQGTKLGVLTQEDPLAKRISVVKKTMTATRWVADPYVNGKLLLGNTKAVTFEVKNPYADDEISKSTSQPLRGLSSDPPTQLQQEQVSQPATQGQSQQQQVPETPRSRWPFTGLLPTAQSVAKLLPIPFSSRRTTSMTESPLQPALASREELDFSRPNPHPISFAPRPHLQANTRVEAQTESQPDQPEVDMRDDADIQDGLAANTNNEMHCSIEGHSDKNAHGNTSKHGTGDTHDSADTSDSKVMNDAPALANATPGPWKRKNLTKGQAEAKRQSEGRQKGLKGLTENLIAESARLQQEKKAFEKEKAEFEREQAEFKAQVTGAKRKRLSSKEPPKRGYHLTYDYSSSDSDEEEDDGQKIVGAQEKRTTSPNPAKRVRVEGSDSGAVIGDLNSAQPYRGHLFSLPQTPVTDIIDNFFGKPSATADTSTQAEDHGEGSQVTTAKHQPNVFKVPSPSDSDWEDTELFDGNETTPNEQSPSAALSQSSFQTSPLASKQAQPRPAAAAPPEASNCMVPPPRPNPGHASLPPPTLPSSGRPTFVVDPVEKARQKALKHQPVTGSRLRESSRLSTSTVGSETVDEPSIVIADDEYDPKHPAIITSPVPNTAQEALPWPGYVNAFDEWTNSVSSRVSEKVKNSWNNAEDDKVAHDQFIQELADFDAIDDGVVVPPQVTDMIDREESRVDTEENGLEISPRVQQVIDSNWRPEDGQVAKDQFELGMASYYGASLGLVA